METLIPFALLCFTSFFTLTNPLGTMPVFLTMTQGMTDKERCSIVKRATLVSFITLMVFVFAGQFLFKFFGISTNGFRIAGGGQLGDLHDVQPPAVNAAGIVLTDPQQPPVHRVHPATAARRVRADHNRVHRVRLDPAQVRAADPEQVQLATEIAEAVAAQPGEQPPVRALLEQHGVGGPLTLKRGGV